MITHASVFDDLRVLDLSTRLSGAFCARLFADFGASVTLAEAPAGHPLRAEPPFLDGRPGWDRSLLHAYVNARKRSVVIDPTERERLATLVTASDVVVTTGDDWPIAGAGVRPDTVQVSVTAHGLTGPLARLPGNDLTAYARSGWAMLNGDADAPPLKGSHNQAGYLGGLNAFVAAVAAVRERDHSGLGQMVDTSELEALTLTAGPALLVAAYSGKVGAPHRPDVVRGPVPCKDGYFALTISRAQFWRDAMTVLGLHDLAQDERYSQGWFRRQQRDHYSGIVEARMREWEKWDLFEALAAVRCVAGVVLDARELLENPHLASRGFFVDALVAGDRRARFPGAPFRMSRTPFSAERGTRSAEQPERQRPIDHVSFPHATEPVDQTYVAESQIEHGRPRSALAGVRALVLTQAWSGTFATELLGLLGADVIQVEARSRPDSWRGDYSGDVPAAIRDHGRRQRAWNTNGLYNAINLNKRGITLDLGHPRGLELFRRMVPSADIMAENFSPRVMGNLGLDYASLRRLKPDIILGSLSAYGATGPYANVPGIGGTIEPMSGMSSLLGYEGGRPQNSGQMYPDPVAGHYFAAALIMALRHRDRTGEGQHIDLGMMEANATFIGDALLEAAANGQVRPRLGNHHRRIAPHNIYRARSVEHGTRSDGVGHVAAPGGALSAGATGSVPMRRRGEVAHPSEGSTLRAPRSAFDWIALSCDSEQVWRALARHIGGDELLHDPRFGTMTERKANEAALDAIIAAWMSERTADEAVAALQPLGVTVAPVRDVLAARDDPQLQARGFCAEVEHPEAGCHRQAGVPWQLSRTPAAVNRPAPMLGEHTRTVLAELLCISDDEYEELVRLGVTGDGPPD